MADEKEWQDKLISRAFEVWAEGEGEVFFKVFKEHGYRRWEISGGPQERGREEKILQKKLDKL